MQAFEFENTVNNKSYPPPKIDAQRLSDKWVSVPFQFEI